MLHCWLCRLRNGVWAKGCRSPLKARKDKEVDHLLEPPGRTQTCRYILDFWPPELQNCKFGCFQPLICDNLLYQQKKSHTQAYVYLSHKEYPTNKSHCWGEFIPLPYFQWKYWKGLGWNMLVWIHWQQFLWALYPVLPWDCPTHPRHCPSCVPKGA